MLGYSDAVNVADTITALSKEQNHPELTGQELLPTRLMRAAAAALPVTAAGISAFTGYRQRVPLGASDDTAALAERLQFTAGEGPCITAHARLQPVYATAQIMAWQWPTFHAELVANTPYRTIVLRGGHVCSQPFGPPLSGWRVSHAAACSYPTFAKPSLRRLRITRW